MKRLWLGIGILGVLLALGCVTALGLRKICEPAAGQLHAAADAAQNGQWEQALACSGQARERWEHYRELNAAVTNHEPMDEIDAMFSALDISARQRDALGFADGCARLSSLIHAISESQSVYWWNVF